MTFSCFIYFLLLSRRCSRSFPVAADVAHRSRPSESKRNAIRKFTEIAEFYEVQRFMDARPRSNLPDVRRFLWIEMEESVRSHAELLLENRESASRTGSGAWALTSVLWGHGGLPFAQIDPCLFSPQDVLKLMSNSFSRMLRRGQSGGALRV
jgi:hypothetical protein